MIPWRGEWQVSRPQRCLLGAARIGFDETSDAQNGEIWIPANHHQHRHLTSADSAGRPLARGPAPPRVLTLCKGRSLQSPVPEFLQNDAAQSRSSGTAR